MADDVANMCWGLATARHCSPALEHIMHAGLHPAAQHTGLLPDGVAKMKARQVTALLWGCSVLLHQPAAVLTNLTTVIQSTTGAISHLAAQPPVLLFASPNITCHLSSLQAMR